VHRDRTPLPRDEPGEARVHVELDLVRHASDLLEANRKFRLVVDAATDAFVGMDRTGRITAWNKQAETTFGWRDEEVVGRSLADTIIPLGNREAHRAGLARFLASGETHILNQRIEVTAVDRGGHEFPVELTVWAVPDHTETVSFNAFIHDISARKREQAELARAVLEAQEASHLKSAFLATMSHEIRTPMNGMIGMASLMLDTDLDDVQRGYADCLRDSGNNLLAITNNILDFSKIEAGKLELEEAEFQLEKAIDAVAYLLSSAAQEKGLDFRVDVSVDIPHWVRGDSLRLRQVLINLVGNAVKFTESGTVALAVAVADGGLTRFSISDTGIGIDRSAQAGLLAPFSQADNSTTRRFGGTGLGLAICVQLVGLMGGTLEFESRIGRGSTFWFDIPIRRGEAPGAAPATGLEAGPHGAFTGERALLADDAEINRIVGTAMLERLGYSVDVVANGAEALAAVRRTRYDTVLMDCVMPIMDGYEATARIRRLAGDARHTPIIAVTAAALLGDREKCLAAGMDDYVSKPLDRDALAAALAPFRARHSPVGPEPQLPDTNGRQAVRASRIDDETIEGLRQLEHTIGPVAYASVCATFRCTYPNQVVELHDAVAAGDFATTARLAHKLKGTTASLGALRVSELAAELERPGQGTDRMGELVAEICDELARVEDLLSRPAPGI